MSWRSFSSGGTTLLSPPLVSPSHAGGAKTEGAGGPPSFATFASDFAAAADLRRRLESLGMVVYVIDDQNGELSLRTRGRSGVITPELAAEIKSLKPALIELIRREPAPVSEAGPPVGQQSFTDADARSLIDWLISRAQANLDRVYVDDPIAVPGGTGLEFHSTNDALRLLNALSPAAGEPTPTDSDRSVILAEAARFRYAVKAIEFDFRGASMQFESKRLHTPKQRSTIFIQGEKSEDSTTIAAGEALPPKCVRWTFEGAARWFKPEEYHAGRA